MSKITVREVTLKLFANDFEYVPWLSRKVFACGRFSDPRGRLWTRKVQIIKVEYCYFLSVLVFSFLTYKTFMELIIYAKFSKQSRKNKFFWRDIKLFAFSWVKSDSRSREPKKVPDPSFFCIFSGHHQTICNTSSRKNRSKATKWSLELPIGQNQYQDSRSRQWQLHSRRTLLSVDSNAFCSIKKSSLSQFLEHTVEIFVAGEVFPVFRTQNPPKIHISCSRRETLVTCHIALDVFSLFAELFFFAECTFSDFKKLALSMRMH